MKFVTTLVALATFSLALGAPAPGAPQDLSLSKSERASLEKEADRVSDEVVALRRQGDWEAALELCYELYAREVDLFGERSWDVAGTHQSLANLLEHLGRVDEAREHLEMVIELAADYPDKPWWMAKAERFMVDFELRCAADPEDRQRLFAAEASGAKILKLFGAERYDEALPMVQEQLDARQVVYGPDHARVALALHGLGLIHVKSRNFEVGEAYWERTLELRRVALGEEDPLTAESLSNLALLWGARGKHFKALPLLETSARVLERTRGANSRELRTVLGVLQGCHYACQDMESAYEVSERLLKLCVETYGADNYRCVEAMNYLAMAQSALGQRAEAQELLGHALAILRERRRPDPAALIQTLGNLAALHADLGDIPRARELLDEALELAATGKGKRNPNYAVLLNNLSQLEVQLGDSVQGIELLRKALEVTEGNLGKDSLMYFSALNNLAVQLGTRGEWTEAFKVAREAREVFAKNNETTSPLYAVALSNQLALYAESGDIDQALELGQEAERIARGASETLQPRFLRLLVNLGMIHLQTGEYEQGQNYLGEALHLAEQELDPRHQDRGLILFQLARLARVRGDLEAAGDFHRRALAVFRENLDLLASAQSERQQLSVLNTNRTVLDSYLSMADLAEISATDLYGHVLAWKGSVFARQARQSFRIGFPQLAQEFAELQQVTDRYASLALAAPADLDDNLRERLADLALRREALERQIAKEAGGADWDTPCSPEDLRTSLPEGVSLVDFLVYSRIAGAPVSGTRDSGAGAATVASLHAEMSVEPHLLAFVLRSDRQVARVELGSYAEIAAAIGAWRTDLGQRDYVAGAAAKRLRKLLWDPLEVFLGESATVLLSPDGALARMPFAALPGSEPKTFLVQDVALGIVAAPRLLPQLLSEKPDTGPLSLLTVGAVDFDASVFEDASVAADSLASLSENEFNSEQEARLGSAVWRGPGDISGWSSLWPFGRLPGSAAEVELIAGTFTEAPKSGQLRQLAGGAATETAFRSLVPGFRFVHLATHGFFAGSATAPTAGGARTRPQLGLGLNALGEFSGPHPGLFSGIVLAGANVRQGARGDDGLITAIEMATLDLGSVELLTLSACDTGLGTASGGENLLGLQRAAQISGARSVLASLWKVQDEATVDWMQRFYRNLWHKGMSRLEAARQVQLDRIRLREDPRLWSAWVLSGDWR